MGKLTHHDLLNLERVQVIGGDLLLLPRIEQEPYEEVRHACAHTVPMHYDVEAAATFRYALLWLEYKKYRQKYRDTPMEPEWVKDMPASIRRRLRAEFAIQDAEILSRPAPLEHAGVSYLLVEGGITDATIRTLGLERLRHIKQLGSLQAPLSGDDWIEKSIGKHDRLQHSMDVTVIARLLAYNMGFGERRMNTVSVLATSHDRGTPAGGDSVKPVDPHAFNEDERYREHVPPKMLRPLVRTFGINSRALYAGVLNNGLEGEILDIADKVAYVARDLQVGIPYLKSMEDKLDQKGINTLFKLVRQNPYVCGVWDSVIAYKGHAVFTDAGRLAVFLLVRALLFRELYYHANARFAEHIMRILVKKLYVEGVLTREAMLTMNDYQLNEVINRAYGVEGPSLSLAERLAVMSPRRKTFREEKREDAEQYLRYVRATGNAFAILEKNHRSIKTKTDFLVMTSNGPRPYLEVQPEVANAIDMAAEIYPAWHVYHLEEEPREFSDQTLARLREAFLLASVS